MNETKRRVHAAGNLRVGRRSKPGTKLFAPPGVPSGAVERPRSKAGHYPVSSWRSTVKLMNPEVFLQLPLWNIWRILLIRDPLNRP